MERTKYFINAVMHPGRLLPHSSGAIIVKWIGHVVANMSFLIYSDS